MKMALLSTFLALSTVIPNKIQAENQRMCSSAFNCLTLERKINWIVVVPYLTDPRQYFLVMCFPSCLAGSNAVAYGDFCHDMTGEF